MRIYAYGIIDSNSEEIASIDGLGGVGVYGIPYRDVGIVVSKGECIRNITREYILKHEEVVEKLARSFTVLPVRFLTTFNQEKEVSAMLKGHYQDFKENLGRLHNKVEFGIKVIWPSKIIKNRISEAFKKFNVNVIAGGNSPGKSFARESFEKYKMDKELVEEADKCIAVVDDYFNRIAGEKKLQKLVSEDLLLNAAYLVEKEKQDEFRQTFEQLKSAPSDLKYLFSGPWPPYNFINLTIKPSAPDYFNARDVFTELVNNLGSREKNII